MAALFTLGAAPAHAAGLGGIEVRSLLGEPFRARLPLIGESDPGMANGCARVRIETLDGDLLAVPTVATQLVGSRVFLNLGTTNAINEPALQVRAMLSCGGAITRTYQVLLDLPAPTATVSTGSAAQVAAHAANMPSVSSPSAGAADAGGGAGAASRIRPATPRASRASEANRARAVSPRKAGSPAQDVLRLSASDTDTSALFVPGLLKLRLSTTLSRLPTASEVAAAQAPAAQDGATLAVQVVPAMEQALRELRADNARWRMQVEAAKTAAESDRRELGFWIKLLATALVLALLGAGWLAWRGYAGQTRARREPLLAGEGMEPDASFGAGTEDGERRHNGGADVMAAEREASLADIVWARSIEPPPEQPAADLSRLSIEPLAASWKPSTSVAEEVEDLLEVVDMWTRLGRADNALEVLAPYKEIEHPVSPVPWLGLLQVYAALDQRDNYETVAERLKAAFNVRTRPWEQRHDDDVPRSLGDFPHLRERIVEGWGTESAVRYLKGLVVNTRHDERLGFDLPVFRDLLRLLQLAEEAARTSSARILTGDARRIVYAPAGQRPVAEAALLC